MTLARLGLALLLLAVPAWAHTTSTGLATLAIDGAALTWRLTLLPSELPPAMGRVLASAGEGERDAVQRVDHELRSRLVVQADGAPCRPGRARVQGSGLGDGRVTFELELRCPAPPARVTVRDDGFDVLGEHHRTLVRVDVGGRGQDVALLPDAREAVFSLSAGTPAFSGSFVRLGVEHILTGWDHLAFLAALVLGGSSAFALLSVVTAFTAAHSVTLALAVFGLMRVPDRLVESMIALSIAWVAMDNVRGGVRRHRWLVSFGFGLVHGLGFAGALRALALPAGRLLWGLVGFNIGVELGQATALAVLFPLLMGVRRLGWERTVVRGCSAALACAGIVWFVGRLAGV